MPSMQPEYFMTKQDFGGIPARPFVRFSEKPGRHHGYRWIGHNGRRDSSKHGL